VYQRNDDRRNDTIKGVTDDIVGIVYAYEYAGKANGAGYHHNRDNAEEQQGFVDG
jgi:hypothetical protein